jgi:hypothetical protein
MNGTHAQQQMNGSMRMNTYDNSSSMTGERLLCSFASLLSSAISDGQEHPSLSFASKAMALPCLISNYSNDCAGNALNSIRNMHMNMADSNTFNPKPKKNSFSFPGLALKSSKSISAKSLNITPQDAAALNLAIPISAHSSSDISTIPITLLQNLRGSLQQLIDSRLRHSILALLPGKKHGFEDNDEWKLQSRMMRRILTTKNVVNITTAVTSFSVVPTSSSSGAANANSSPDLSEQTNALNNMKRNTGDTRANKNSSSNKTPSLPLVLEIVMDMKILGKRHTISLQAQGTIQGQIHHIDNLLSSVHVALDTMGLLRDMMSQARLVVKNTMKRAARIMTHWMERQIVKAKLRSIITNGSLNSLHGGDGGAIVSNEESRIRNGNGNNENSGDSQAYPIHLLETVKHFSQKGDNGEDWSTEGFPPQLAATLKSLGPQDVLDQIRHPNPSSFSSVSPDPHFTSGDCSTGQKPRPAEKPLHHELFSWMHNDDMILKEEPVVQSDEEENSRPMPSLLSSLKWDSFTQLAEGKDPNSGNGSKGVLRNGSRQINHENSPRSLKKRKAVSFSFSHEN